MAGVGGFGGRVFQARKALEQRLGRSVPQTEIAERMGFHGVTVGSWEKGTKEPNLETIARLAIALGVGASWLAFGDAAPAGFVEVVPKKTTPDKEAVPVVPVPDIHPLQKEVRRFPPPPVIPLKTSDKAKVPLKNERGSTG